MKKSEGEYSSIVDLTPRGLLYYYHAAHFNHNAASYPYFLKQTPYMVINSGDMAMSPYR